jgi:hypothetical protein
LAEPRDVDAARPRLAGEVRPAMSTTVVPRVTRAGKAHRDGLSLFRSSTIMRCSL